MGMLLTAVVTAANVQERQAAKAVFLEAVDDAPSLELVWADSGYQGQLETSVPIVCGFSLAIVKRTEPGFKLLPRRWVVERTFAWLDRNHRLSKDYEQLPEVSQAMVYVAMVRLMLRRLVSASCIT
jgi:putative transposase